MARSARSRGRWNGRGGAVPGGMRSRRSRRCSTTRRDMPGSSRGSASRYPQRLRSSRSASGCKATHQRIWAR
ncbi:MAG: hypothetical protein E6I52_03650 [Chloroflexi bacterium]|nr:MAG: hypothetical protein E6I52_03650 [Chloroflexota bacterium]